MAKKHSSVQKEECWLLFLLRGWEQCSFQNMFQKNPDCLYFMKTKVQSTCLLVLKNTCEMFYWDTLHVDTKLCLNLQIWFLTSGIVVWRKDPFQIYHTVFYTDWNFLSWISGLHGQEVLKVLWMKSLQLLNSHVNRSIFVTTDRQLLCICWWRKLENADKWTLSWDCFVK